MTTNGNKECVEIQIKVPWGHIAGKWWGPRNVRPILALHGWQDNAATFDTLAPLLPGSISLLAIDFPCHGMSSRLPDGIMFHAMDNVLIILLIMKTYNWEKISILGHSMGSIVGFKFAGLFPDKVDLLIGIDALKPHIRSADSIPETIAQRHGEFLAANERNRSQEEPSSYTYDECIERAYMGRFKSVNRDKCAYLLKRNLIKSSKFPNKYYFNRDHRLINYNFGTLSQETCLEFAKRITAPHLFIKATNSPYYEEEEYFHETVEVLKNNLKFELHYVEGTHHVHLNSPDKVSGIICDFINKYISPDISQLAKL